TVRGDLPRGPRRRSGPAGRQRHQLRGGCQGGRVVSEEAIAQRYAQAIFELGVEANNLSALSGEITRVAEAYSASPEMRAMMNNPLIPESARLAAINEITDRLSLSPLGKNALGLLTHRRRLFALPAIARELDRLADERAGIVRATAV